MRSLVTAFCLGLGLGVNSGSASAAELIYQQKSLYRNILVLDDLGPSRNMRCMMFGFRSGYQSCVIAGSEALPLSYTKALLLSWFLHETPPERALVIGLGGGSMPRAFQRLHPTVQVDTVELDAAVGEVAKQFFNYQPNDQSKLHIDDARVFVRRAIRQGKAYDLIIVDAFDKEYVPEHLLSQEFLMQLKQLMAPGGVLAANTFGNTKLSRYETATYQSVFGDLAEARPDHGNRIVLAMRDRGWPSLDEIRQRVEASESLLKLLGVDGRDLLSWLRKVKSQPINPKLILTDQYSPANLLLTIHEQ